MARGKLSQQIKEGTSDQRLSRTEKRIEKLRQINERRKFEALKEEAKNVQEKQFSNVKSVEEYKEKYNELRSDLKQFFQTPEQVKKERDVRIEQTKSQVQEQLSYAEQQKILEKQKFEREQQKYEERREYARQNYSGERYKEKVKQIKDNFRDEEDDYEEKLRFWDGYIKGLNQGNSKLSQGQDLSIDDIKGYANDIGNYEEERKRAKNEQREYERTQQRKIDDLIEQGYKPMLIQQFDKAGKPTTAKVTFYSAEKNEYAKTDLQLETQDVSKLEKSKIEKAKISQTFNLGGKKFTFETTQPIFKTKKGQLTTAFGDVGKTEDQVIKEQQEKVLSEWREQNKEPLNIEEVEKKTTFVDRSINKVKDFFGGFALSFTGTSFPKLTIERKKEDSAGQDLAQALFDYGLENVKKGYEKIPSPDLYIKTDPIDLAFSTIVPFGAISLTGKTSESDIRVADLKEKGLQKIEAGLLSAQQEDLDKINLEKIERETQQINQAAFERKYFERIITGDITFEEASKEYEKTETAQLIRQNYETRIENELTELGFTKGGFKQAGLQLAATGLTLVPTTTKGAVITAAGVYGGVKVVQVIPASIQLSALGLTGAYGGYKTFSPTSSPTERASGVITLAISGATLGYGAFRYLRAPVIKTEKIPVPNLQEKAGRIIGFEQPKVIVKNIYGKTTIYETTEYPTTLSRQIIEGQKTIITSRGRNILNKIGVNIDPIYKGIPTEQLGRVYQVNGIRGSFTIREASGYQKALKRLTSYGYSESQAKAVLRFSAPKIIETEVSGVNVLVYGDEITPYSFSRTNVITRQSKTIIDEQVTSRGAKTIKDVYESEKTIIGTQEDFSVIRETSRKTTGFLTDKGGWYNKLSQAGKTEEIYERLIFAKASDIKTGTALTGIDPKLRILIGEEYRFQNLREFFAQRRIIPKQLRTQFGEGKVKLIKNEDIIYYDKREATGLSVEKFLVPKPQKPITPIEKMSNEQLKQLVKDLQKVYGKGSKDKRTIFNVEQKNDIQDVVKEIQKFDEAKETLKTPSVEQSQFYGKGQYERTDAVAGFSPQQIKSLDLQEFKSLSFPDQRVSDLKRVIKLRDFDIISNAKLNQLLSLESATALRSDQGVRSELKMDNMLKTDLKTKQLLKEEVILKQQNQQELKQNNVLKSYLRSVLDVSLTTPILETPTRIPTPKGFPKFSLPKVDKLKNILKERGRKTRVVEDYYYVPDFTSRALGLEPIKIKDLDQANKLLKQIQTGLEVRRGVRVQIPN